jgi:hypothetical protein
MNIRGQSDVESTKAKLRRLEEAVAQLKQHPGSNPYVDDLTLRSLQSQIKERHPEQVAGHQPLDPAVDGPLRPPG